MLAMQSPLSVAYFLNRSSTNANVEKCQDADRKSYNDNAMNETNRSKRRDCRPRKCLNVYSRHQRYATLLTGSSSSSSSRSGSMPTV